MEEAGKHPIPDSLIPRKLPSGTARAKNHGPMDGGFLEQLLRRAEHVPTFLRGVYLGCLA